MTWNYFEPGEDTMGDVPPVKDAADLQDLIERLRDDADGAAREAYQDAAELVEAHRIHKLHDTIRSEQTIDRIGSYARVSALMLAFLSGFALPVPDLQPEAAVESVFAASANAVLSFEFAATFVLLAAAVLLQAYAQWRDYKREVPT